MNFWYTFSFIILYLEASWSPFRTSDILCKYKYLIKIAFFVYLIDVSSKLLFLLQILSVKNIVISMRLILRQIDQIQFSCPTCLLLVYVKMANMHRFTTVYRIMVSIYLITIIKFLYFFRFITVQHRHIAASVDCGGYIYDWLRHIVDSSRLVWLIHC